MKFSESNFIRIIKDFSKKEIKRFEKFINSPYFNSQLLLSELFKEIIKFYPEFEYPVFNKESIFKKVFPKSRYDDLLMRKYISNLYKLAQDFLIHDSLSENKEKKLTFLLDAYYKRDLKFFFEKQIIQNEIECSERLSTGSFLCKHEHEQIKTYFYIKINRYDIAIQSLRKSQLYLFLHLLLVSTINLNFNFLSINNYNVEDENKFIEKTFNLFDIINFLENSDLLSEDEKWLINICKTENLLYSDPYSKDNLRIMKDLILNVSESIDKNLLYVFINHLNNYYLLNLSENVDDLRKDLFNNYKFMFEKGFFTLNDKAFISYSEYRSVLHISMRLKNVEWAEQFVEHFKNMFKSEKKEYIYDYSKALLYYEEKKYKDSLKIISNLYSRDPIVKIDIDILRLKIFYELDYFDSSISVINSLRNYIYNNSYLNKEIINSFLKFLKYYRIILDEKKLRPADREIEFMRAEVSLTKKISNKDWLLEKLDLLLNTAGFSEEELKSEMV